ncbi:MAG: TonB-dependent receptor plug domain-containing protein, partial [Longimicrobiales bacterium]
VVLVALAGATPVSAQVRDTTRTDTTVYRIGEIVVQAARPVTTTGGSSAIEVSLDSLTLPSSPTLAQVLHEVPAMHVRTNSRGETEITVRGSESRQVAVLLDGVPLTLGWDSRTDVSVIPANALQELTLIRGLSSVLHGPNTLGGIVMLSVGQASVARRRSFEVAAGFDQVGGYSTSAAAAVPVETESGRWLFRGGLGYRDTPGNTLPDGVVEPVPASDDDLRLNTDAEEVDGFLSGRYAGDGGAWFSFSGSAFRAERGIAAELGVSEPRLWRYPQIARGIAVVSAGTGDRNTPFGGRGDLEASIGVDISRTEIDAFETLAYENIIEQENGDDRTITVRLLGDHTLGSRGDLRTAFTYADISHDEFLIPGGESNYRQRMWSLGAETDWRLIENAGAGLSSLRLSIGGAFDGADTPETGGKPALDRLTDWGARVGATAAVAGGDAILHAGVSRRARFPALRELYSGALGRFEPNPGLNPERLVATEAGVTTRLGNGEMQVVGFHHRLSDAVVRIRTEEGKQKRVNRDQLVSTGLEILASQQIGALSLAGDVTIQTVDLKDPDAGTS